MADITVDACVLRSAGRTDVDIAIGARRILDEAQRASVVVIVDDRLQAEWDRHASSYAIEWRAAMESAGRIFVVNRPSVYEGALRIALDYLDPGSAKCAWKDRHLVLVSYAHSTVVVSFEKASRNVFSVLARRLDFLSVVPWAGLGDLDGVCRVLQGDAVPDSWFLCFSA